MEPTSERDTSPEAIRDRVESKQDEFAGGSEPGWQRLEATVDDTRHQASQEWSGHTGDTAAAPAGGTGASETSQQSFGDTGSSGFGTGQQVGGGSLSMEGGIEPQRSSQDFSAVERAADGDTGDSLSARDAQVADIPSSPEHPVGVGQQCFKCGAYNDVDAESCWNCSEALTHSMTETPGVVESVVPGSTGDAAASADADAGSDEPNAGVAGYSDPGTAGEGASTADGSPPTGARPTSPL